MSVRSFLALTITLLAAAGIVSPVGFSARAQDTRSLGPSSQVPGTAASSQQRTQAFGNWTVQQDVVTQGFSLTGRATGDEQGELWLRCEKNGALMVGVPMPGKGTSQDRRKTQVITIRADEQPSREMMFLVFEGFVALAMDAEGLQNDRVATFIELLQKSKKSFGLSYDQTRIEFDVAEFPAARARFQQLCVPRPTR